MAKRYIIALKVVLAKPLVEEAVKQGRSMTNMANWILANYLIDRGHRVTSGDISEWEIRHKICDSRKKKAGENSSEHGRSEGSDSVSGVQEQSKDNDPGVNGAGPSS